MSHLPRLIRIISVIAKYRLDAFLVGQPGTALLRLALLPWKLRWAFSKARHFTRNQRLRLAMEELGPIYIKFGQLLSTRRDFIAVELAEELRSLQDNVPPFTSPSIEQIVADTLDAPATEVFRSLDSQPFASASVAQVHRATLHSGEEVVVKVLRPGIEDTVRQDIKLLKWVARLIATRTKFGKRLRPVEVVNDYEGVILGELNLQAEGANASQLKRNFEGSPDLYVPKIYWDYTRRNILVMERIYGIPVTDINALHDCNINLKKLAETGVNIFFSQVFEHNFFHADMHPGNIFVAREHPENPQYIAIDCAIIGSLSRDDKDYLAKNLLAIFKRDYRRVAELHVECGWVPPETQVHAFESAMRSVCEPIFEKPLKDISFAHLLVQLFSTAGRFNMEVQPSLVLLQKTLLNVEGMGRQLYPDLDLWQTALPFLENWQRKQLSPFTLFEELKEQLPNWLDQLPHLPVQVINALVQADKLTSINATLAEQLEATRKLRELQAQRRQRGGIIVLAAAGITLLPAVQSVLTTGSIITVGLAAVGVFLLSFKQ